MPDPLPGMAAVAEYGDRFAADVAFARLTEYGIVSTVLGDPASSVAPHHVTHPGFRVLVLEAELGDAQDVLGMDGFDASDEADRIDEIDALDATYFHRDFRERPRWVRLVTWTTLAAFAGPVAMIAIVQSYFVLRSLFP